MNVQINSHGYVIDVDGPDGIEMPEDITPTQSLRYKRVDDEWVDAFPDEEGDSFLSSYNALVDGWAVADMKPGIISAIKAEAARQIEALAWKVERATEVDAVNDSNTLADVYAERAAIRAASNAHEEALDDITTLADLQEFNPTGF